MTYINQAMKQFNIDTTYAMRMQKMDLPSYMYQIGICENVISETIAEAGPNFQHCDTTMRVLRKAADEGNEIERCARERYQDWASDFEY